MGTFFYINSRLASRDFETILTFAPRVIVSIDTVAPFEGASLFINDGSLRGVVGERMLNAGRPDWRKGRDLICAVTGEFAGGDILLSGRTISMGRGTLTMEIGRAFYELARRFRDVEYTFRGPIKPLSILPRDILASMRAAEVRMAAEPR